MTIAWFLVPYARRPGQTVARYVAIDDFTTQIQSEGGDWAETEVLGNMAAVKVRASAATIAQLDALYFKIPATALDNTLSSLTNAEKTALQTQILALGYTNAEVLAALGNNIGQKTLRQVLNFIASRRITVRYNKTIDAFVFDGAPVIPTPIDVVDAQVQ
jgi:hypothetical protein